MNIIIEEAYSLNTLDHNTDLAFEDSSDSSFDYYTFLDLDLVLALLDSL